MQVLKFLGRREDVRLAYEVTVVESVKKLRSKANARLGEKETEE